MYLPETERLPCSYNKSIFPLKRHGDDGRGCLINDHCVSIGSYDYW